MGRNKTNCEDCGKLCIGTRCRDCWEIDCKRKENKVCTECGKEKVYAKGLCGACYSKKWRKENPIKFKIGVQKWRKENPDKVKAHDKKKYEKNPDKVKIRVQKWRKENPDKVKAQRDKRYKDNPEKVLDGNRRYRKKNPDKIKAQNKKYRQKNPEKIKLINKKYRKENPEKVKLYRNKPNVNISCRLRVRLGKALKSYTNNGKVKSSDEYGINYKAILEHLKPFPVDRHLYHIDHIRPLCSFNFINKDGTQNLEEIKKAFAPENHQWLLSLENSSKNGKWNKEIAEKYGVEYQA